MPSINPSTGEVLADVADADAEDVQRAVAAARRAFEGPWRTTSPVARQRLLWKIADVLEANYAELKTLTAADMGTPVGRDPRVGAEYVMDMVRYFAGWPTKISGETLPNSVPGMLTYTRKEPIGVVGALRAVQQPAHPVREEARRGARDRLHDGGEAGGSGQLDHPPGRRSCSMEAGVPEGVVNVITGGPAAGAAIVEHPDVDSIVFTGSTTVGQELVRAAAGNLKRLTLELGGKSPDIIFADADLERAVPTAAMMVFANSGQGCSNGTRIFVERAVHDEVVEGLAADGRTLKIGNSLDPETFLGPVDHRAAPVAGDGLHREREGRGRPLVAGGNRVEDGELAKGYFVAPTVFVDVQDTMRIAREEIFGPVACVLPFDSDEEVVARRERHQLRARGRRVDPRHRPGPPSRRRAPRGNRVGEHLQPARSRGALRWLPDERLGQGGGCGVAGGVPQHEGRLDQHAID